MVRLAVLALFGVGMARAQELAPRSVTLDEALKAADLLPDIKAAEAAMRAAEAGVKSAGRLQEATFSFATRSNVRRLRPRAAPARASASVRSRLT